MLYGVEPTDPLALAAAVGLLLLVGMLAAFVPARRASLTDPGTRAPAVILAGTRRRTDEAATGTARRFCSGRSRNR